MKDDFKAFANRAFEQGFEMYREDYRQRPELRADVRSGYSELKDIVRFATAHNLNWAADHIRSIQNIELRAHLLVSAAEECRSAARQLLSKQMGTTHRWYHDSAATYRSQQRAGEVIRGSLHNDVLHGLMTTGEVFA